MSLTHALRSLFTRPAAHRRPRTPIRRPALPYRPTLESLEDRTIPSAGVAPAPLAPPTLAAAAQAPAAQQLVSNLPLSITGVTAQNGQLVALGQLGSHP